MSCTGSSSSIPLNNSELQATLEFCVELHKFYNVDLFLRGHYQLQVGLRVLNSKVPVRVEVVVSSNSNGGNKVPSSDGVNKKGGNKESTPPTTTTTTTTTTSSSSSSPLPTTTTTNNSSTNLPPLPPIPSQSTGATSDSSVTSGTPPFRILFRNEELDLKHIFLFRIHFTQEITSSNNIQKLLTEEITRAEYFLDIKLCFNDAVVSSRACQIHYYLQGSLHYYRNVFFDYFHLCAVSFSVHGGVVALHISKGTLLNCGKQQHQPDLLMSSENAQYSPTHSTSTSSSSCIPSSSSSTSNSLLCSSYSSSQHTRILTTAKATHEAIMNILLESNSSLKTRLVEFLQVLGHNNQQNNSKDTLMLDSFKESKLLPHLASVNFDTFIKEGKKDPSSLQTFLLQAHKQIAHLCAENILLWHRFLDLIIGKDPVRVYLANMHHQLRVKRWSEGFYITENPLRSAYTQKDYSPIVDLLKKSINYTPLPVECVEIDGDSGSIPIVFEDSFSNTNNSCFGGGTEQVSIGEKPSTSSSIATPSRSKDPLEEKILCSECSCGLAKKPPLDGATTTKKTVTSPTELTAKLTLLLQKERKTGNSQNNTLPRRHSQQGFNEKKISKKKLHSNNKQLLRRRFNSTPFLNNSSCDVVEGGHVMSDDDDESGGSGRSGLSSSSSDDDESVSSGFEESQHHFGFHRKGNNKKELMVLPPPIQFADMDTSPSTNNTVLNPPEEFRDASTGKQEGTEEKTVDPGEVEIKASSSSSSSSSPCSCSNTKISTTTTLIKLTPSQAKPIPKETQNKQNINLPIPYFLIPDELRIFHPKGLHLIICVHGLDGSCHDLRLFKIYLEVSLPGHNVHFLMSEKNQDGTTFTSFETMTTKLITEILSYIETNKLNPQRISFVGHSLGNIIIRSALANPGLAHLLPKLHTFLSLSGPHLGTLYNTGIVNMGMWLMQKWKKSSSLLQLQLKDSSNIRSTFIYKLSEKSNLHFFKNVLLCGSSQDRYVPVHSAHVINCKGSLKDGSSQGEAYREMVMNILNPILKGNTTKLIRYDVHHAINPHTANSLIGRAAHIAVLDSEIFIEKFLSVSAVGYFQ